MIPFLTPKAAVALGWSIIPTGLDKKPKISTWKPFQYRQPTEEELSVWQALHPAGWAMVTGAISRRITLDFDGAPGLQTLERLGLNPHRSTPNGGYHVDFRHPGWFVRTLNGKSKKTMGEKWPGLDIRADGGYACILGRTDRGAYAWLRDVEPFELDILPVTLRLDLDLLWRPAALKRSVNGKVYVSRSAAMATNGRVNSELLIRKALARIGNDGRNNGGFWLAIQLRDNGYTRGEAETVMSKYQICCPATNMKDYDEPYTDAEVKSSIKQAYSNPAREPWSRSDRWSGAVMAVDPTEEEGPLLVPGDRRLPAIQINARELRDISSDALAALLASNSPPKLFARGASIVRVDESDEGRPLIVKLTDRHLIGEMTRTADYFRLTMDGKRSPTNPPLNVAKDLLTRPIQELRFPTLVAVAESPFLRPDGTIVSQPGYDSATRTYYKPYGMLDDFHVPLAPKVDDVDAARELILEVFCNFPFVDAAGKANALALFVTPELRAAIDGPVPMALIDAPQAGTGKGLLVECVHIKTTGMPAVMKPTPARNDESEWRKNLTATIERGGIFAVFDNIESVLDSSSLALALTATSYEDRILGKSENTPPLPQRLVFVMTGNNLALGGDLPRRCYWIRVDAEDSRPWLRKPEVFKHPDLKAWVLANRGRLLSAVLTLGRAWFLAGRPPAPTPILGSFEEWSKIIGGVLAFCGVDGFLGNLDSLYDESDPSQNAWEAFLAALMEKMPSAGFKAADLTDRIKSDPDLAAILPEDLGMLDPLEKFQRRLGNAFRKRGKRRYGERALHIARSGTHQGAVIWTILGRRS